MIQCAESVLSGVKQLGQQDAAVDPAWWQLLAAGLMRMAWMTSGSQPKVNRKILQVCLMIHHAK